MFRAKRRRKTMKRLQVIGAASALLLLAAPAFAEMDAAKPEKGMGCPMSDTADMQKNMSTMISEMGAMMKDASDPAMKERMQKMQDQMAAMMSMMQKMGGGMMGGGMKGGGMMKGGQGSGEMKAPAAPSPDDHKSHHPTE
ncbi:hypothetical protein QM467_18705 [Rhodoblastus sp. 17X3]|uniref:hypothetical protein n=1 Tax=Rhodoblastus sp. 17X3 TaxID=3047026 RepID=UPI0024B839BF|nr:hypothetical protein [Rhodoblastus sp. 17X3]MDI9850070.1 hypothetical protein [Rhodoblastus sp. 17X3]